ncbi:MerR-like DNA binding protein [Rhodovulum imhoffii]|uniref:MerR-like DNA binding protein n=1 Tax=Rhodovulum imhoffii TaxID=365340 RepID=A0A2T5BVN0_9RHOB|nr:MerR family transcriptional regulator [Rhodovulum imhoffii]MBK5932797.1 hypothetical protein [Rhodovulum imhoffii]PTN03634.1 MerR-like DNA binding protein [Rhodovulum imhoffii]
MAKSPEAFRTISEVADWLETPAHVLRFWESRFSQIKPLKRAGGRRYYRPSDMLLLGGIKKLLHDDGMTIRGVQKILREKGVGYVSGMSPSLDGTPPPEQQRDPSPAPRTGNAPQTHRPVATPQPEVLPPPPPAAPPPHDAPETSPAPKPRRTLGEGLPATDPQDDDPAFEPTRQLLNQRLSAPELLPALYPADKDALVEILHRLRTLRRGMERAETP